MKLSDGIAKQKNPSARVNYSDAYIKERIPAFNAHNEPVTLSVVTIRRKATQDFDQPRFYVGTKTMLMAKGDNNKTRAIWKCIVRSEVDNTVSTTEPSSDHQFSGYCERERYHPYITIDNNLRNTLRAITYQHHDIHKTDVVLELNGLKPNDFIEFMDSRV